MKTNEPWPHNWKGHIMITFLKVIFALTQVCEPDTQHNLVLPSGRCSCRQCMASWWTAPACPRGWTRTGSGGGRGPAGAQWTSSSWCLWWGRRDQACQEDVSPETLSVMLWCHLPNIFNLCNCFNSSTSLKRRSRSSCFLRFQRDLWIKVQDNSCQMIDPHWPALLHYLPLLFFPEGFVLVNVLRHHFLQITAGY